MTSIGEALALGLRDRGVEVVFGIPGVHTIELYRGLPASGLRHVTPRHEQGAGFMADGFARVSGKPGVAFVITGPGLTNTLTAMAQARADSVPMLVISGVNARPTLGKGLGELHELPDQRSLAACVALTSTRIERAEDVGPALDAAFARLASGRGGPVHIEVPTDVMPLPCPVPAAPAQRAAAPQPPEEAIAAAAARLAAARQPVILAGGGCRHHAAALQALAEALDAPVIQTVNARGLMHNHPLAVPASPSLDPVRALLSEADVVLALGTELGSTDYDMYKNGGFPALPGLIRVDIDAAQLARHPAALTVLAEAGAAMTALTGALPERPATNGAARAAATRQAARSALTALNPEMPAQLEMLEAARAALPGAIIVGDSTQPVYAGNLYYDHDRPGGWFNAATGYGALGYATGAAVGAAIAAPGTPVICLAGDGGLMFSPAEIMAAVDEGLDITYVVWNNAGFGEIASAMRDVGVPVTGCDPTPPHMEPFAAACGLPFVSIGRDPGAFASALAGPRDGPRMIEITMR